MSFRIKPLLNGFVVIVLSLIVLLVTTVIYRLQEIRIQNSYLQNTVIPLVASLAEARFQTVQIQQFMTDASVTGENDGLVDAGKAKDAALAALQRAAEFMPELKSQTTGLQVSLQQLHDMGTEMAKAYKEGQAAGNEIMKKKGGFDELAEQTHEQVDTLNKKVLEAQADSMTRLNQTITLTSWLVLGLSILTVLVMIGSVRLLYRSVFSQLGGEPVQANAMTAMLAKGDLSQRFSESSPAGSLIASLMQMQLCWIDVVGQIILKGKQLYVISHQVSSGAKQLASNSKTQSDATEAITVNIEELSVAIDNMSAATERIEESGRSTSSGEQMIGRVVKQIQESASSVKHSAGEITTLNSKAAQISSIIQVIREIADQTNLLALNAAIEAARAGESGRGFAVVADEVRKLAERTSASTQSISTLIDEIGVSTHQVVSTIEDGVQKVELSVDYAHEALLSMNAIRDDAEQVRSELRHIHTALEETRSNAHDIARKVEQVALMAHDNFDAASALANNTADLDDLANKLEHTMGFFRMPA